jgi:transposase InsO family protein
VDTFAKLRRERKGVEWRRLVVNLRMISSGKRWLLDRDAARRDLFAYIEGYYNRQRIHSAIGYVTPHQQRQCQA